MRRWWLWAALGAALLLVSSQQTWVTGTVQDPVLGASVVEASGTQAGSTLTAGALLAGAALLAGLVGSRPVRLAAGICLAGGAVLAGLPALRSLSSPQAVARAVAADRPGAAGQSIRIDDAAATLGPWVGLLAALLVLAGAVLCLLWWVRAPRPATGAEPTGGAPRRSTRPRDPWDDLTHGQDPTVED
ncbi:Trp biosynthesis-associated membrane protein [Ornithinimicrobium cavernae]|uniref:Trp biosynthesis-associated membrane protein n=1 Tax=Ornithinimicrobium cavernae TaxID=2666047 RepID=UPI000D69883B|nr:Trp biosynthesis-associated membrane protein [Ornithinimicrobium cavernae]